MPAGKDLIAAFNIRPFRLRQATAGDARAVAAVHVRSWRESYQQMLPRSMLDRLSVDSRSRMWEGQLAHTDPSSLLSVPVAELDGEIVGFGACNRQRMKELADLGYGGEFAALYVLRKAQGLCIGRALMRAMAHSLIDGGVTRASLWVLTENLKARQFYEDLGGAPGPEIEDRRSDATLHETAYLWRDVSVLA